MKGRNSRALLTYFGFIGPGLLIYLFIVAYPIVYSVWLSFTDYNPNTGGIGNFVGFLQWKTMFEDPAFWHAFKNTMTVVSISVFGQIPIGFILAYILFRKMVRGEHFFQSMVFLPNFLSTIVIGTLWKRLVAADGPFSRLIQLTSGDPGAQFDLMLDAGTIMIPIGSALIWMYTGLYMVIFLANLQKINNSLIEAAKIDGASEIQIFLRVVVPLLAGSILVSTILAIAGSLRGFDLIFAMTSPGLTRMNAEVLTIFMYRTAFQDYANPLRFAYGSAISNSIVVISVILIMFSNFVGKKVSPEEGA